MRRSVALVLVLSCSHPVVASAQAPAVDVEAAARRGSELYEAGKYTEAVAVYLEAWRAAPAAALLYNVAHIYDRKLAERELAIEFYRKYIVSPDADPAVVARATERIQLLKQDAEAPAPAPPQVPPQVQTLSDDGPAPVATARNTPADGGLDQRTWGWIAAGTGAALLAGGGVLGYIASVHADDFSESTELDDKRAYRDAGRAQALTADILMGVGLAAGVTGAVLLLTADDGVAVGAAASPSGGLVFVGGAL